MHMNALDSRGCLRGVGEFLAEVPIADGTPFIKGLWDFTHPPSRPIFLFGDFNVQACSTPFSENCGSKYVQIKPPCATNSTLIFFKKKLLTCDQLTGHIVESGGQTLQKPWKISALEPCNRLMSSWEFKEITCDPCTNHWAIRKLSSPSKPVSLIGCPTSSAKFLTMQKASANSKSNPKSPGSFTWDFLGSWDPLTKKVDAEGN